LTNALESGILPNHLNNRSQRQQKNTLRREARAKAARKDASAREHLADLKEQIDELQESVRQLAITEKELKEFGGMDIALATVQEKLCSKREELQTLRDKFKSLKTSSGVKAIKKRITKASTDCYKVGGSLPEYLRCFAHQLLFVGAWRHRAGCGY
jgi:chromosome segregation ATPase